LLSHFPSFVIALILLCSLFVRSSFLSLTFSLSFRLLFLSSVAPGTSITGSYSLGTGSVEQDSSSAIAAAADLLIAYGQAVAAVCPPANFVVELSGLTLYPGVYCSATAVKLSAVTLTLDGNNTANPQWIFQVGSDLTTSTATSFILTNGATEDGIYWAIGGSAYIGYSSSFKGTILSATSVSFGSSATIVGRALAAAAGGS
jgi:hypothetical protein